ncbi:MAG: hypothetical protein N2513_02965 [Deltaproteobacteria bacterium]|nr:hypothetical protein [Deltaproteobacteria bacterium]
MNLQWEDVVFDQNLIIAPEIDTKYSPGVPFKNKLLKCLKGNKVFREFFNKDLSEAGIKKDHIVLRGIEASLFRFITY